MKRRHRGIYEKTPGSGVYWIRYAGPAGRIRREKAGTLRVAIKLVQKRRVEVLERKKLPELHRRGVTFGELAADTLRYSKDHKRDYINTKVRISKLLGWWKDRPADSLGPEEIEEKLGSVNGWSDATRNRYKAALSLAYNLGIRHGKVSVNPARIVPARPERNVRQGFIDDRQYSKLAQACSALWLRAMLALGYTFGWRAGELVKLRVGQVDIMARTVRLEPGTTKNREGRTIKLTDECFELVKTCALGKGQGDFLFTYEDGQPVRAYRYFWEQLCARVGLGRFVCGSCKAPGLATTAAGRPCPACRKAGRSGVYAYQGLLFHDLRRSAVRNLERGGVPRSVAMKITGHKTEATYRRYAIVSESDLTAAVEKLERLRLEPKNELTPELTPATGSQAGNSGKLM